MLLRSLERRKPPMCFDRISTEPGLNALSTNPCSLLDFAKLSLAPEERFEGNTGGCEVLLVTLSGEATVKACGVGFGGIGGRSSVFDGKPHAVYLPPGCVYEVSVAESGVSFEAALPMALAEDGSAPFLIDPEDVRSSKRGVSNFSREDREILVEGQHPGRRVHRLIVGETFVPSGNWSVFPPHRHERNDPPNEAALEEMDYFRVSPRDGWGLARHYMDSQDADSAHTVKDDSVLMMPKGYHTVVCRPRAARPTACGSWPARPAPWPPKSIHGVGGYCTPFQ
jgi:5-deoxy-glucuronate isomerase